MAKKKTLKLYKARKHDIFYCEGHDRHFILKLKIRRLWTDTNLIEMKTIDALRAHVTQAFNRIKRSL